MEIEQKERERIEADIDAYIVEAITHFRAGKQSEHLHLQKEVIQPLRKSLEDEQATAQHWLTEYKKLEAEIKALRRGLSLARSWLRDDYSPSDNKLYFMDLKTIDQLLTKNEG